METVIDLTGAAAHSSPCGVREVGTICTQENMSVSLTAHVYVVKQWC